MVDAGRNCGASQVRMHARRGLQVDFVSVLDGWPENLGSKVARVVVTSSGGSALCRLVADRRITMRALQNAVLQHCDVPVSVREILLKTGRQWADDRPLIHVGDAIATISLSGHAPQVLYDGDVLGDDGHRVTAFLESYGVDDINTQDVCGVSGSVLHFALACGDTEACLAILNSKNFNGVNAKNGFGQTALHVACAFGASGVGAAVTQHPEFVELYARDDNGCVADALQPPKHEASPPTVPRS